MLLVKKVPFYTAFVILALIMLVLGVLNFSRLSGMSALLLTRGSVHDVEQVTMDLKFYAESLLYLSFLGTAVLLAALFIVHRGGVRVLTQIDKATELSRQGRYFSGESVKKLGKLGEKITRLFGELKRLDTMKSLKISELTNLAGFLLEESHIHCFIADTQGRIGQVSRQLAERLKIDKLDMRGRTVADVIGDLDFKEVLTRLEQERVPVQKKGLVLRIGDTRAQGQLTFHPVFNSRNELAAVACISEKETLLEEISKKADQIKEAQKKITGIFRRRSPGGD